MALNKPKRMLSGILWDETSGVDHPANEEEGWLMMKSLGISEEMLKAESERIEKQDKLHSILSAIDWNESPFKEAPEEVKTAVQALVSWLEAEGFKSDGKEDYGYSQPGKENKAVSIPKKKLMSALMDAVKTVFTRKSADHSMDEEEVMLAIVDSWEPFCKDVSTIVQCSSCDKTLLLNRAVDSLMENVNKSLDKEVA